MTMTEQMLIEIEERKIADTDTSEITYQTSNHETEKQLLTGVGFEPIRETEQYTLYRRGKTFALLIGTWVIQGTVDYIIWQLTEADTDKFDFIIVDIDMELWNLLLNLIRGEGI